MSVTLDQINKFNQRIADASFNLDQLPQARQELTSYIAKKQSNPQIQQAIEQGRVLLSTREEQAATAQKIQQLYKTIAEVQVFLTSQPKLNTQQYNQLNQCLDSLRTNAQPLDERLFLATFPKTKFIEYIDLFKQHLRQRDPNAWKTDLIARAIIVTSIAALFGSQLGWNGVGLSLVGSAVSMGIERAFPKLIQGITHGAVWAFNSLFPTPAPEH
jgi:hypothetical protein